MIPNTLADRLPTGGVMGALRTSRPALYYLVLAVGAAAFCATLLTALYALLLLPLVAARAAVAVAQGDPVLAAAWIALVAAVGALVAGVVVAVGRWAGEFTSRE